MPQQSFRKPSTSALDRTQSDPTASENTPKLGFRWKKDGKLSKDYVCSLSGKSSNPDGSKRKNREPDITIALFRHFKEITLYEPNLSRVEMEDPKGLEVVLLLGAIVIREVFNGSMRETFNITGSSRRNSAENAPHTSPLNPTSNPPPPPPRRHHHQSSQNATVTPPVQPQQQPTSRPPPTDPRSQWELDAETARLRKAVEYEERNRRRAEHAETKRIKRMLEEEERRAHEKQKEVDRETERLKKLYGKQPTQGRQQVNIRPSQPPARYSQGHPVTAYQPTPMQRPHSAAPDPYLASNLQNTRPTGPYLQPQDVGSASGFVGPNVSTFFGGSSSDSRPAMVPKKSFWGLRGGGGDNSRLTKQKSTVF